MKRYDWINLACRLLVGVTFVFSGFVKTVDPWGTALKINEYLAIYGMEFLRPASMAFSIWLCGAELMMGLMLLFGVRTRLVSVLAFGAMIFFTLLTFLSATWIPVEDCGCFGDAVKLTPWQTFFKNLILLPLSAVLWYRSRHGKAFSFNRREAVLTLCFFLLSMGLGTWCYRHLPLLDFLPYREGVDLRSAWMSPAGDIYGEEVKTTLIYRNLQTGELREFTLDDTEWQDAEVWEWVETRTESGDEPLKQPMIGEFALHAGDEDVTEAVLNLEGRVYLLCAADPQRIGRRCAERFGQLAAQAAAEDAEIFCLTPARRDDMPACRFGDLEVEVFNIDATTLKTLLRADAGVVVLDDGVIQSKRNCRDIPSLIDKAR